MRTVKFVVCLSLTIASGVAPVYAAEYSHPSGIAFDYPQEWQLRELDESLLIVPPVLKKKSSVATDNSLPERFIWVGSEAVAPGVPIDHPEIGAYFDNAVISVYPQAKRFSASTQGNIGEFEFTVSTDRRIDVLYRLESGLALFMAHSYRPDNESNQDSVFMETFESFRVKLNKDENLVGSWYRSDTSMTDVTYDSSSIGSSYASASSQHQYTFFPNNRFEYKSSAQVYAQSDGGGSSGSTSSGGANPVDGGTYAANGSILSLAWDGGDTDECPYNTFIRHDGTPALKLQCGDDAKFYTFSD